MSENDSCSKVSFKQKKSKKHELCLIYAYLFLIMHARDTILLIQQLIIITKAPVKFQPDWLEIFPEKVKKVKKNIDYAQLCACHRHHLY